ncbi:TolC family protein [Flavobacterium seoulense]|uniref:Transporter n=1 Tax=Flavobacterium seoulense TaxID=1492738 RepID=A0A066WWB9_9FLAO|nr:TolC family protein [Flavobacterium seoulense]KDN56848.1 transporter [Flavobacterium seoulense]
MNPKKYFSLLLLTVGFYSSGQTKQWTLEECVRYALENNISIRQSDLDAQTARIDKKDAFGNFLPSASASASHSWNIGLNQDITTGLLQNQTIQFTSAGASVGIDIYKGLQNLNTLRKANLSIVAAKYQLQKMKDDISLNVADAYLQVLFNKENLKVQNEQLAIDNKQLSRTQELVNAGNLPKGDLLDVKATIASDNQKVITAENALLISKLSLAQLLQLDSFDKFDVADANEFQMDQSILSENPTTIYEKAKQERMELKIAQTNLEIAEKNVSIARGAYQPTLQGFYNFNSRVSYADIALRDNVTGAIIGTQSPPKFMDQFNDNKGQSFGAQLNIPIFNGFSVRNNVERNKVSLEKSKIALEQQELDLERNVYTAFTDAKGALKSYESAVEALDARTQSYNYSKDKFEVGLMNAFELSQSQTLLANAQSEVIRTKYDYIFKTKILEFYFGIPIIKN